MPLPDEEKRPDYEDLAAALDGGLEGLKKFLEDTHPADLADWIAELDRNDTARVLALLDVERRSELLHFAEDTERVQILEQLDVAEIVAVVEELPADEVVDILALTDDERTELILRTVDFDRAQGLRQLARYDEETAGGLMTVEFVAVHADVHVGDAIKVIRTEQGPAAEEEGGVFVIDEDGKPVGYVSDRELLKTQIHTPISEVMETDLITVSAHDDQEEVAQLVHKYNFAAVPVVDASGALIGIVSAEDALDVLQEEAEEDIMRLVGATPQVQLTRLPIWQRVRHRLPLQLLTVLGGLLTAKLLALLLGTTAEAQEHAVQDFLRYLPIIIGLAGNVGIQSSTILVRAFATGEVGADREGAVLKSELLVGLSIGLICGVLTFVMASLLEDNWEFGATVGASVAMAVVWAALLGSIVPLYCQRRGIDPAIVAGPILITLSDISGAVIFGCIAKITFLKGG
jgi:magnesium transporter